MKQTRLASTDLICLECGYVTSIIRCGDRLKDDEHIKDMYCPMCKEDRKFLELKDASVFWHKYNLSDDLSDNKKIAIELKNREINQKLLSIQEILQDKKELYNQWNETIRTLI